MDLAAPPPLREPDSGLVDALRPSPNHGERRAGCRPHLILLHYTGMPDGAGAIAWLCDPRSQVSCHYVVEEDGHIVQLVAEERRAWHAGRSVWAGEDDINSASVGIEIVNPGHDGGLPPFPDRQIEAVGRLCSDIAGRLAIAPEGVLAHSDVAPGRKQDPGERFPWDRLHRAGVGRWVPPGPVGDPLIGPGASDAAVSRLQADLARLGYGLSPTGLLDEATRTVVRSFQLRFRQACCDGRVDAGTLATLAALLETRAGAGFRRSGPAAPACPAR